MKNTNLFEIKNAIKLLEENGYIVRKLTKGQLKDLEDCDNSDGNKECLGCSCNVCIAD